jgi:hypothetical protein
VKKLFVLLISFISIAASGFFPYNAAGNEAPKQDIQPFTNKDLEKYHNTSESKPAVPDPMLKDTKSEKIVKTEKSREQKEKEYWCKKTTPYRRKIEKAKDDIREIEKSGKITKQLKKKLEVVKKQLKTAEQDLADIEDEAYRKRIPPGWLRCQFE